VSEQFLNGTAAQNRLYSAIQKECSLENGNKKPCTSSF